jgi:hypothetical protein
MEPTQNQSEMQRSLQNWERKQKTGKILGGLFVLLAGLLLLLREMGQEIPHWIFTWPVLLIVIGIVGAAKNGFSRPFWFFPLAIGSIFLFDGFYPDAFNPSLVWPVALILLGLFIMLKPRRKGPGGPEFWKKKWAERVDKYHEGNAFDTVSPKEKVEYNAIFSGIQKNIITKEFKGGEINAVFGGIEVNLVQADFKDRISLEVNAVLGGVKLILPPHWEIKSELNCIFGGIEDGRALVSPQEGESKILVLEGNVFMGGIEIKSF